MQQNVGSAPPDNPAQNNRAENPNPLPVVLMNESIATRVIEDDELSIFESLTVRYARWGFSLAVVTFVVAMLTGFVFFYQLKEFAAQTDVLEQNVKQTRIDSKNTALAVKTQLSTAQEQVKAAQDSAVAIQGQVDVMRRQWRDERRPILGLKDGITLVKESSFDVGGNKYIQWGITAPIWNFGPYPATRVITIADTGNKLPYRLHGNWKNTDKCKDAAKLSASSPDYYPDAQAVFPNSPLPFSEAPQGPADSIYLAVCIAYTDFTNRPYTTKLLYIRTQDGFRLLDAEVK